MDSNKLINWNFVSVLLTGKKNVIRSNFCPEQYKEVVNDLQLTVKGWYEINFDDIGVIKDVEIKSKVEKVLEEKIVEKTEKKIEPQVVEEVIKEPVKEVKKIDEDMMAKLRDIASGNNLSGGFELTKKKVNIDDVYSFEYVKGFPDLEDCIFVDKKGIACYDKYNLGIFYIKWDGKFLMFDDKKEFERFCKDNLII